LTIFKGIVKGMNRAKNFASNCREKLAKKNLLDLHYNGDCKNVVSRRFPSERHNGVEDLSQIN
jgi:hypothetical protein